MLPERKWVYPQWLSNQKSIVQPSDFSGQINAEDAVLCFSEGLFSRLANAFNLNKGRNAPQFPGALQGVLNEDIAICQGFFGGSAAGMLMEALIASGVERFVMVGEAGSITPECTTGDLFLPRWGVREDGTSYHYLPANSWCEVSEELFEVIKGYFRPPKCMEGGIWTTDAPFRETMDKIQRYAKEGVLAVDMECTALMSISMYRNVDFAAVFVITDELFSGEWIRGFGTQEVTRNQDDICQTLADRFYRKGGFV